LSIPVGLFITAKNTGLNYSRRTQIYHKLLSTGTTGVIVTVVAVLPLSIIVNTNTLVMLFSLGLPLTVLLITIGTAGIATCVAQYAGIQGLNKAAHVSRFAAYPIFVLTVVSSVAYITTGPNYYGESLGLTGGQWQDFYLMSLAALTLLHAAFTLYFWRKLRSKLPASPPPPAPPPAA